MLRPSAICGSSRSPARERRQEQHAEGRIAVHQDAAFAVEHRAAGRNDRNRPDAVAFGELRIAIRIDDLQLPNPNKRRAIINDDVGGDGPVAPAACVYHCEMYWHVDPARPLRRATC